MLVASLVNTMFGLVNGSDSDFPALLPFDDSEILTSNEGSFMVNVIFLPIFTY